jgi:Fuc2NAc and GlcNAc transferase
VGNRPDARIAIARSVLDIPNERSSHSTPVPRGGGVAIVVVVLMESWAGTAGGWIRGTIAVALVPSGAAVALVSWLDDRRGVPQPVRFLVHLAAAAWWCSVSPGGGLRRRPPRASRGDCDLAGHHLGGESLQLHGRHRRLAAGEALSVGLAATLLCWRAGDLEPTWLAAL